MTKGLKVCSLLASLLAFESQLGLSPSIFLHLKGNENYSVLLGTLLNLNEIIKHVKWAAPCTQ